MLGFPCSSVEVTPQHFYHNLEMVAAWAAFLFKPFYIILFLTIVLRKGQNRQQALRLHVYALCFPSAAFLSHLRPKDGNVLH